MWLDIIAALVREFGWQLAILILVVGALAGSVKVLAIRLERAYDKRLEDNNANHANEIKTLEKGHANEILALRAHSEKGWAMSAAFQAQAERLAERYADSTELARDLADEVLDRRRTRRPAARG